jgi:hypothetical protein
MSEASTAASPPAGRGLQVLSAPVVVPAAAAVAGGRARVRRLLRVDGAVSET